MNSPRERPILFSGPLVQALLAGRKSVTRRVVKPQPERDKSISWLTNIVGRPPSFAVWKMLCSTVREVSCPYGEPGDRLVVREAFRLPAKFDDLSPTAIGAKALDAGYRSPWAPVLYVADGDCRNWDKSWGEWGKKRNPLFMPRWASRLTLEVVSVRVERLHDITEEDAKAEGCVSDVDALKALSHVRGAPAVACVPSRIMSARDHFRDLWRSINGTESWDANPWVWRIEVRKVDAPAQEVAHG